MSDDYNSKYVEERQAELSVVQPFHGDCSREAPVDQDGVQAASGMDWRGRELPDAVPLAPPVGFSQGPSLADFVHRMLRSEALRARAEAEGFDTEEEANDFEVEDDTIDYNIPFEDGYQPYAPPDPRGDTASRGGSSGSSESPAAVSAAVAEGGNGGDAGGKARGSAAAPPTEGAGTT